MRIPLDHESLTPLYQQIEAYLHQSILSGSLAAGTRLPAARQLAVDLGVNRITVESAYAQLESDGLIWRRVGSGTYVSTLAPAPALPQTDPDAPWPIWQQELQAHTGRAGLSTPDDLLQASGHPNPISFAGGSGDAHLFPVDDLRKVIQAVMRRDGISALEYGEHRGYAPLRATIAQVLGSQGIQVHPDQILITAGSQQALALAAQTLLKPGDTVLVESPTYGAGLDLFQSLGVKAIGVPVDERGMQVEKLEKLIQQHRPRLVYTIPNFQNPTGTCLSNPRRRQLIALADQYNLPVLEDDFVGDLRYEGRALPALKSLDPGGRVIYISTFSKMLMPGLRVGFLAAEGPVYDSLVSCKRVHDLTTSSLYQRALQAYVTVGRYQAHLRRSCQAYRKRRDAMLLGIHRHMPGDTLVTPPQGGLFIWACLPGRKPGEDLLAAACQEGVAFAPGSMFYPSGEPDEYSMRLNFASHSPETIEEGLRRLGKAVRK